MGLAMGNLKRFWTRYGNSARLPRDEDLGMGVRGPM
jgi:hypothetical protein